MGPTLRRVLAAGVVVAAIGVIMRPRFPDTASRPALMTLYSIATRFAYTIGSVGECFGLSKVGVLRTLSRGLLLFDRTWATVEEYSTEMEGVEVVVYRPAGVRDGLRPGIVYFHGGGWSMLSPGHTAPTCRLIVENTNSIIVSVNYRLAPEHVFPVPLQDCVTVTKHLLQHGEQYGMDRHRIAVKGDSAGGNLAMATSLQLTRDGDPDLPPLRLMSLDYPGLQALDLRLPSYRRHEHGPGVLDRRMMIEYFNNYAFGHQDHSDLFNANNHTSTHAISSRADYVNWKDLPEEFTAEFNKDTSKDKQHQQTDDTIERHDNSDRGDQHGDEESIPGDSDAICDSKRETQEQIERIVLDPLFSPLMATDEELSLLPPAYIVSVEFDVLRDDAFLAAARLERVGVDVKHSHVASEQHGIFSVLAAGNPVAVEEIQKFSKYFNSVMS